MTILISSGQGPVEASYAVQCVFDWFENNYKSFINYDSIYRYTNDKSVDNLPRSILFDLIDDISPEMQKIFKIADGTWQVKFKSPYRKDCKRTNWFVGVSIIDDKEIVNNKIDPKNINIERFHCGGHGGQNINKVETGIRIKYKDITVEATEERSQYLNRQNAMKKLYKEISIRESKQLEKQEHEFWQKHYELERGNPVMIITPLD